MEAYFDLDALCESGELDVGSDVVEQQVDAAFDFSSEPAEVIFDGADSALPGPGERFYQTVAPGSAFSSLQVPAGFTGHFDGGSFVPDCPGCGAWQPYEGHCFCTYVGKYDDDFDWSGLDSVFGGAALLVFGGETSVGVSRVKPEYPYLDGYCWLLAFDAASRAAIVSDVDIRPELSIAGIVNLGRLYTYNAELLELAKVSDGKYHFSPALPGSRTARTFVEWLNEIYTPCGLFSNAKHGVFGSVHAAAESYSGWTTRGPAAVASRGSWLDLSRFSEVVKMCFQDPFSKVSHRKTLLAELQQCQVHGVVTKYRRFPREGCYVSLNSPLIGLSFQQAVSAATYKDGSKDDKAKSDVSESGDFRERGYGDSLASFGNAMASILRNIYVSAEVHDRGSFERVYSLRWSGVDDSLQGVWREFNANARALSCFPWMSGSDVDACLASLENLDMSLNDHLPRILAAVSSNLLLESPFTFTRRLDLSGEEAVVSVCAGDWPSKLFRLVMVAGYLDGTKDEKFKRGQQLPETKSQDRDDMKQQFIRTVGDIRKQYSQYSFFITDEDDLRRLLGIVAKPSEEIPDQEVVFDFDE